MPEEHVVSVYVTAGSATEARRLARVVLEERLAACANIVPARSLFWWKGRIEETREHVIFLKTRALLLDDLLLVVRAVHTYETPCVVAFDLLAGDRDYLEWVRAETTRPSPARGTPRRGASPRRASRASPKRSAPASRRAGRSRTRRA